MVEEYYYKILVNSNRLMDGEISLEEWVLVYDKLLKEIDELGIQQQLDAYRKQKR